MSIIIIIITKTTEPGMSPRKKKTKVAVTEIKAEKERN